MILVLAVVWGGFGYLIVRAVRRERAKKDSIS